MKKSCLFRFIFISVILLAIVVYLFQYKYNSIVSDKTNNVLMSLLNDNIENGLNFVEDTKQKIVFKNLLKAAKNNWDEIKSLSTEKKDELIKTIKKVLGDSLITGNELKQFKNYIRELQNYK